MDIRDFPPMLLDQRPLAFDAPGFIWEIKFDGWRITAMFGDGKCVLRTRNGAIATKWFPEIYRSLVAVKGGPYIVDGEVCVFDESGRSDFERLQTRAKFRRWVEGGDTVGYAVFDLMVHGGHDITRLSLLRRKDLLAELLDPAPDNVLAVGHFESHIARVFKEGVIAKELEGLVAKRTDSLYLPGVRTRDWVKVKRKGAVPAERFKYS
jgi:bifunctional non-homologous end joining protein LigD